MFRSPIAALAVCGLVFPSAASDAALASFIDSARGADIVVLGEIHDNPRHHEIQAEIVQALQPAAIVFEMIPQAMEDEVNALMSSLEEGTGPQEGEDGVTTRKWRICPTFKNVSGTQVGLTVVVVAFSALRAS